MSKPTPKAIVPPKVKRACDLMIFEGTAWQEAAAAAGLTTRQLRLHLEKPATIQYLRQQREVFREAICSRNNLRLQEIRDQDDNKTAAVQAIKVLETRPEEIGGAGSARTPGVVIVIGSTPQPVTIEAHAISTDSAYPSDSDD
jgi:hypothetical protein